MKRFDGALIKISRPSFLELVKTNKKISANLFKQEPALAYA